MQGTRVASRVMKTGGNHNKMSGTQKCKYVKYESRDLEINERPGSSEQLASVGFWRSGCDAIPARGGCPLWLE